MRHLSDKIVDDASLKNICRQAKAEGKTVVSTSGCFDLLHAGHVKYLEQAKEKGDLLILLLNSDASVKRLKGAQRPIVNQLDRAAVAAGLESVDYLCLFDEDTPCGLIRTLQPDVRQRVFWKKYGVRRTIAMEQEERRNDNCHRRSRLYRELRGSGIK